MTLKQWLRNWWWRMSNPIFSSFNRNSTPQPNNVFNMINQIKSAANPQQAAEQMLFNNPNFKEVMNYINQNGGDAKTAFYNLAAQKGVDPNAILNQLK